MVIEVSVLNCFQTLCEQRRDLCWRQNDAVLAVGRKKTTDLSWIQAGKDQRLAAAVLNLPYAFVVEGKAQSLRWAKALDVAKPAQVNLQRVVSNGIGSW